MSETDTAREDHHGPGLYEIRIKGHLNDRWAEWFDGLTITRENSGETLISGLVVDQAALYGLLRRVRDLGMPLLSIIQVDGKEQKGPDTNSGPDQDRSHQETDL